MPMGVAGVERFDVGVRLIWYGCCPASMGVLTPAVEYNSPPMLQPVCVDVWSFGHRQAVTAHWSAA